jgi:hypothetical protein
MNQTVNLIETLPAIPSKFSHIQRYAAWALPTQVLRNSKRAVTSIDELKVVYDALLPEMENIMAYLDTFPFDQALPEEEENLKNLALAFMEISHPIELGWKQGFNTLGFPISRLEIPEL